MRTTEITGLLLATVSLAGLSVAIIYGDRTAKLFTAGGNAWAKILKTATLQG